MRPGRARLFGWGALICLPAVLLCLAGCYYLIEEVPAIARRQKARQTRECRREAERLVATPTDADRRFTERPKGWRQTGKLRTGQRWGYVEAEAVDGTRAGNRLAWVEFGENDLRGVWLELDEEPDLELLFSIAIPAVLLIVLLLTGVGLRFFLLFAKGREDFLSAAAHDLTTPLVGMRMMIGRNNDEARALTERLLRIVANINDFLKLGGKRPPPRRERVDLLACYHEAYGLFREDFRELNAGHDLPLFINGDRPLKNGDRPPAADGDRPLLVRGDQTLIVQILWNLLGNDLKYAAPFGRVSVRMRRTGGQTPVEMRGQTLVEIADEGPGLTRAQMRRAFDRFYRAKTVLESGKGGFGIGLCSAREFARAMGGDLTVRANQPKGCVFTLVLPAYEGGEKE